MSKILLKALFTFLAICDMYMFFNCIVYIFSADNFLVAIGGIIFAPIFVWSAWDLTRTVVKGGKQDV